MKKLLKLVGIAIILFSSSTFAQTAQQLADFEITASVNTDFSNSLVAEFIKYSNIQNSNPDLKFDEEKTQILTLKNNLTAIRFTVTDNSDYNTIYALYYKDLDYFDYYLMNNTPESISVFTPEKEPIITYVNNNGYVAIGNLAERRSPFGQCMDAVEDDFTNDFVGYVAWHTSPLPGLVAATMCGLCVKKHVSCPPAYHP